MLRNLPSTDLRQRRSLLLGFAALIGSGVLMWKWENRGPACRKVGKRLRYRAQDVRAWVETCETAGGGS